ncbi:Bacterial extracellular solute-binding protein, family 3 [compost metagenome]
MRRLLPLSLAFALHATSWANSAIDVVILCDAGYPPYSYAEGGEAKGIYTDILREAFLRMPDYRVEVRPVAWARGLAELASGKAFALFPPYYRPRERPWMDYSRPLVMESVAVFVRAELVRELPVEDFPYGYGGLRVGVNRGFRSIVDPDYQAMVESGVLRESYANDNRTNLLKLYRRRIDVYINDRRAVLWQLSRMQREGVFAADELDWL